MITLKNGKKIELPETVLTVLRKADDAKGYAVAVGTGFVAGLATAKTKFRKERGFGNEYEDDYRNIGLLTDAETH